MASNPAYNEYLKMIAEMNGEEAPPKKIKVDRNRFGTRDQFTGKLQDVVRTLFQGRSLGAGDEIVGFARGVLPGGPSIKEAIAEERQALADTPGLVRAAGEIAGGFKTASKITDLMGKNPGMVKRGAVGGATGLLYGANSAEGDLGSRLAAAKQEGGLGAILGVLVPGAQAAPRVVGNRGARVADELAKATGLPTNIRQVRADAAHAIRDVRSRMFRPLEEKIGVIGGEAPTEVESALVEALLDPEVLRFAPRSVATNSMHGGLKVVGPWSYKAVVGKGGLLERLRKAAVKDPALAQKVQDIEEGLVAAYPEHGEASRAYAAAMSAKRAIDAGRKTGGIQQSAVALEEALAAVPDEHKLVFRAQQLYELTRRPALLKKLVNSNDEVRAQVKTLFGDEAKFAEFMEVMQKEKNGARIARVMKALLPVGVIAGAEKLELIDWSDKF